MFLFSCFFFCFGGGGGGVIMSRIIQGPEGDTISNYSDPDITPKNSGAPVFRKGLLKRVPQALADASSWLQRP